MSDVRADDGVPSQTMCGWCLVGDHEHHREGSPASAGGKAWQCICEPCLSRPST